MATAQPSANESTQNAPPATAGSENPPSLPLAGVPNNDLAGVLRRNQACLQCRSRKLRCDAARPHCATCIRSHRHLLRTSPHSQAVLTCTYEDVKTAADGTRSPASNEDESGSARKKRKAAPAGEGRRRKDTEAELLKRKIEALEAQLAAKTGHSTPTKSNLIDAQDTVSAASPTALLELLSSTASAYAPGQSSGLKSSASGAAMMNGATGVAVPSGPALDQMSGLTPMFTFDDDATSSRPGPAPLTRGGGARQTSPVAGVSMPSVPSSISGSNTATDSQMPFTPSAFLNFLPHPTSISDVQGSGYTPQFDAQGNLKPSGKTTGPWRDIETVDSYIANATAAAAAGVASNSFGSSGTSTDVPPLDEKLQQQLLMDLFWPGWPPNMPEPHIVNDLIEAFFELVPNLPRMLHRPRFLARMALPPTHSNFPHPALIHSICSIASSWCAPNLFERSNLAPTFDVDAGKFVTFGARQATLGKEAVHDGLNTGNRMFDVVRAMMILSRIFIDDTRMLECWAYNGLVARMILPLGLNVRSAGLSLKSVMLPPPADAIEREERRASMWFALLHDTIASAASGWGTSIALDELSIPLPVSQQDFDSSLDYIEENPQDLESPDLFSSHPVPDPFVLSIKAAVLLNRANKFARKWKNRHVRDDDDFDGMQRPEFRELANAIACFQMSFPMEMRNPCMMSASRKLDIDLIAAHLIPHTAIICLYEPFADIADLTDPATRRLLSAAQAIVGTVQQLAAMVLEGVQNFTNVMHSSTSVCLVTSARTCLLFYRHALNVGDTALAESLRSDVEMIRMALAQLGLKFKIGHHHAQLVEYFMDRATHPTYDKMAAHYPEHPRAGAPALTPQADLGVCVMNALNVKRGYWRVPRFSAHGFGAAAGAAAGSRSGSAGISPYASTPGSAGGAGHAQPQPQQGQRQGFVPASAGGNGHWNMGSGGYTGASGTGNGTGTGTGATSGGGSPAAKSSAATNAALRAPPDGNTAYMQPEMSTAYGNGHFSHAGFIYNVRVDGTRERFGLDSGLGNSVGGMGDYGTGPGSGRTGVLEERYAPAAGASGQGQYAGMGSTGAISGMGMSMGVGIGQEYGHYQSQAPATGAGAGAGAAPAPAPVKGEYRSRAQAYFGLSQSLDRGTRAYPLPSGMPNSASWFMGTGTERVYDRDPVPAPALASVPVPEGGAGAADASVGLGGQSGKVGDDGLPSLDFALGVGVGVGVGGGEGVFGFDMRPTGSMQATVQDLDDEA